MALRAPRPSAAYLWFRVFFWCAVIFYFSSKPNYEGRTLTFETLHGILEFAFRKTSHLAEYFILAVFTLRAVEETRKGSFRARFFLTFCFALLYSVSDEWHQTFVFGRTGTVVDVFIDSLGILAGCLYCRFISHQKTDET